MEKRKFARTTLISDYNTEFQMGDQKYSNIHVSNIGTNGCCVQMPVGSAKYLKTKPMLDNMILLHAHDKRYSLKGQVAWCEDVLGSKSPWVTAGVEFLDTPEDCREEIKEYVQATTRKL